jgi:hypothetical protein
MDADCDTHDHVLGAFSDAAIDAQEVGTFESFETETETMVSKASPEGREEWKTH